MEMVEKLFALRPILNKNVFPFDVFYKYICMCPFSLILSTFNARCGKIQICEIMNFERKIKYGCHWQCSE